MPPKKKTTPPRNSTPTPRASGGGRSGRRPAPPPVMVSRPKPWGLIALTLVLVVFAGLVIGYAVFRLNKSSETSPEAKAKDAKAIPGIVVKDFPSRNHVQGVVNYTDSPPFGGDHDPTWADCNGTVYPSELRKENAVHMLEHGAVWITYKPGLAADQLDALKKKVAGVGYMALSPYPGLKTNVSLQSWGHQLFVDSASDPRVDRFVDDLRLNSAVTPEFGATCTNPDFKANPTAPDPSGAAAPSASATAG
ncbi:MAG: DUF3105 domain-containing protein [Catenulispora sp.]